VKFSDRPSPTAHRWYAGKDVPGVVHVPSDNGGIPDSWYVQMLSGLRVELSPGDWVIDYHDGTYGVRRATVEEL
jgi:hypothetical protein